MRSAVRDLSRPLPTGSPDHFYAVDFARGIAALVVLIWHYQHFFFLVPGVQRMSVPRDAQPFYQWLQPAYVNGHLAVQFFWLLSGFVFAAVYGGKSTTLRLFTINRVARLYPLHIVTLLAVALLQMISVAAIGRPQIYLNNDLYHFLLNLGFASHWGLERGFSFNGPAWSISIEILVYAVFWCTLCVIFRFGIVLPALVTVVGWFIHYRVVNGQANSFFQCVLYFYLGCGVYLWARSFYNRGWVLMTTGLLLLTWGGLIGLLRPDSVDWLGVPPISAGTLLLLCAIKAFGQDHRFRAVRWVGDNTYGTYLWHVPIQIALLIALDGLVGSRDVALRPWFLLVFIALVMLVARLSFIWVEAPARERIRRYARS